MYTRKENSCIFCVGTEIILVTTENIVDIPHETRNRFALWHSNATTEYVSKDGKTSVYGRYITPSMFLSVWVTTVKMQNQL